MQLADKVVIVTGGANGIGRAMCRAFARERARGIVVVDRDESVRDVAREVGGVPAVADVTDESAIAAVIQRAVASFGRIDLFCSNAGVAIGGALETTTDAEWQRIWEVNLMAHVYAARHVVPTMIAAGGGYLLQTASAAGLLSQVGSAPYAVTKHAAVAFAEWLAITYGARGIKVSCLCPQGVRTSMLTGTAHGIRHLLEETALEPESVADAVVAGIAAERFLIAPHAEVLEYFRRKAADYDRWIRGMQRLQAKVGE
jgi:NAD(P)-dependent dehydrogenase (short-subunit alcohol dehydrogenase family)